VDGSIGKDYPVEKINQKNKDYTVVIFILNAEMNVMHVTVESMSVNMLVDSEYTENTLPYGVL
jgi:hypothetical protein